MMIRCLVLMLWAACAWSAVPTPSRYFGHPIGADRVLLDWSKVTGYFQQLAQTSDRVKFEELGKSTEGRPFIAVTIAAPETLRNLDRYRQIQQRLADPRGLRETEAESLVREGKTVVLITCSIHATEVASTHSAIEFAYRLVTEDRPKFRAILANTIFILVPSLNPDGVDIVTQWYRQTLNTPYEGTSPPRLYHKYVGHDNNRDWYIFSQAETRHTIAKLQNVWHPQIVYDVHQQGPYASRMFVPPWLDPVDPNIDPIIAQLCNAIGAGMAADLTSAGRKGVAINAMYDFWTPARHYQSYHGGLRILSESASARLASPITVKPEQISSNALGYDPRQPSWNYLEPWLGGEWRLRDIIDDQLIAMESCLYQAAVRREDMLRSFLAIGRRALARQTPYAFVLSSSQADPGASEKLLQTLHFGQVEMEQAVDTFEADGHRYPAGSYVIRLQQPYGSFAKTLLERQQYPDLRLYPGGPPKRPYDVTAQTLPLLMGVTTATIKDRFTASLKKTDQFQFPSHNTADRLAAADTNSWRAVNALWKQGRTVYRDMVRGDFYRAKGDSPTIKPLKQPRIGLYRSFVPAMDEGWTRWLLEEFGFAFQNVENATLRSGNLRQKYDVIVVPDQAPNTITEGYRAGTMPPEYTGGLGSPGADALKAFAAAGGTVLFLNDSCEYAIQQLGLKVRNVVHGVPNREFYSPGSLLNATLDQQHPLSYGLPAQFTIWSEGSPAFEATDGASIRSVVRYPSSQLLASGWLLGEKYLANHAALADVPLGQGHILLFGMRPQYRAQSYQTFKLFFNALLYF